MVTQIKDFPASIKQFWLLEGTKNCPVVTPKPSESRRPMQ